MNIKSILNLEKGKELSVAGAKGSIPAAITTGIISAIASYVGIDLDASNIASIFFGAGMGSIIGQFQKNPKDALHRIRGVFGK